MFVPTAYGAARPGNKIETFIISLQTYQINMLHKVKILINVFGSSKITIKFLVEKHFVTFSFAHSFKEFKNCRFFFLFICKT